MKDQKPIQDNSDSDEWAQRPRSFNAGVHSDGYLHLTPFIISQHSNGHFDNDSLFMTNTTSKTHANI